MSAKNKALDLTQPLGTGSLLSSLQTTTLVPGFFAKFASRIKKLVSSFAFNLKQSFAIYSFSIKQLLQNLLLTKIVSLILINLGMILLLFFVWQRVLPAISKPQQKKLASYLHSIQDNRPARPVQVYIPWLVDVKVREQILIKDQWITNETQASHLLSSARPGEKGNIIIYGHNQRTILGNIRVLEAGDEITIKTADGSDHLYSVQETMTVGSKDTHYLLPTEQETLTIYTCTGLADQQRFVVRATAKLNAAAKID